MLEKAPEGAGCYPCGGENVSLIDTGLEVDGGRVHICEACVIKAAKLFRIGTAAARALEEAEQERKALEQSVADAALERERLTAQLEETRDKLHTAESSWRVVLEHTGTLHALASQAVQG